MYLPRTSCIICTETIKKINYNLKSTYSEKSKTPLIEFVKDYYDNVFLLHCNICNWCFDLLNELDSLREREKEVRDKLSKFISKVEKRPDNLPVKKTESFPISASASEMQSSINKIEIDECPAFVNDIDFTKLPIKVKRVVPAPTSSQTSSRSLKTEGIKQFKKIKVDVSNDEVFEQIQNSIQKDLTKHVEKNQLKPPPTKNILCEICGMNFKTQSVYEKHTKKHDDINDEMKLLSLNKVDDVVICNECGKQFNHKYQLAKHTIIHTGVTRYQCDECGKKFIHHSSFSMHMKIHRNERNYKCEKCCRCFLTSSHLKRHMRCMHEKEKTFPCHICGRKFAENYNMDAHLKSVHWKESFIELEVPQEDQEQEPELVDPTTTVYFIQGDTLVKQENIIQDINSDFLKSETVIHANLVKNDLPEAVLMGTLEKGGLIDNFGKEDLGESYLL